MEIEYSTTNSSILGRARMVLEFCCREKQELRSSSIFLKSFRTALLGCIWGMGCKTIIAGNDFSLTCCIRCIYNESTDSMPSMPYTFYCNYTNKSRKVGLIRLSQCLSLRLTYSGTWAFRPHQWRMGPGGSPPQPQHTPEFITHSLPTQEQQLQQSRQLGLELSEAHHQASRTSRFEVE